MWAVRLEEVSKRYPRGGPGYAHFGSVLTGLGRRLVPGGRRRERRAPTGPLALDDVTLEVGAGESFGLIGPNGAGKSTLLRLISRISYPSGGRIRVRGRVGALIEVGSGIHPELTGRENVWLYGTILGLSRTQIRARFDDIIAFAQLESVVDTQVKYYSSGMQLRLGFSVAAHLEPEIFVVDEALSVGDALFQARAVERMRELLKTGTTLIFVSHDLGAVEALCDRAGLIDAGRLLQTGPPKDVLGAYLSRVEDQRLDLVGAPENDGIVRVVTATCHDADGAERYRFTRRESVELRLTFRSDAPTERPHVAVGFTDGRPHYPVIECSMRDDDRSVPDAVPGLWTCSLHVDALPLRPRRYEIWCEVFGADGFGRLMDWIHVASLRIEPDDAEGKLAVVNAALVGPVAVDHAWAVAGTPAGDR